MRVTSPFRSEPSTELVLHGLHGAILLLANCYKVVHLFIYWHTSIKFSMIPPLFLPLYDTVIVWVVRLQFFDIMGGELASQSEQPVKIRHLSLDSRTFWVLGVGRLEGAS